MFCFNVGVCLDFLRLAPLAPTSSLFQSTLAVFRVALDFVQRILAQGAKPHSPLPEALSVNLIPFRSRTYNPPLVRDPYSPQCVGPYKLHRRRSSKQVSNFIDSEPEVSRATLAFD